MIVLSQTLQVRQWVNTTSRKLNCGDFRLTAILDVWMYDKKTRNFVRAIIAKVAQPPDFYSQDVECTLADKLREGAIVVLLATLDDSFSR